MIGQELQDLTGLPGAVGSCFSSQAMVHSNIVTKKLQTTHAAKSMDNR